MNNTPGQVGWRVTSLLAGLFLLAGSLAAQQGSFPLTLHVEDSPMGEVLDRIESQTGLSFSYSTRLIDEQERVTLHVTEASLEETLTDLFRHRRVKFEVVERQIVLKRARRSQDDRQKSIPGDSTDTGSLKYTVSGYAKDAASGEILIGATVSIPGESTGTISNQYGFYSMTLRRDVGELMCSYVGYQTQLESLREGEDQTIHFALQKEVAQLSEVTIYSGEVESIIRSSRSSEEQLRPESVRKMPALFGEKDVIKSLAAIPGIKFFGDGSTIFFVRGGSRDQNMITIDEAPVYNPTHLLGYFSTIVPDAVKDVKIYKGDFPANYGGRLSSLIDIRTKDGKEVPLDIIVYATGFFAYSDMKKQDDFSETSKSYEKMIFWSNYDTADSFRDPQEREIHPADIDGLKDIKVTSYSVKKVSVSEDQSEVHQTVEIGYYRVDEVTLKTMRDQQVWVYNPIAKRWYLQSGLPLFK